MVYGVSQAIQQIPPHHHHRYCPPAFQHSDWRISEASLIRSPRMTEEEEIAVREAGSEVARLHHHNLEGTRVGLETAWFVNPPVSTLRNSVPSDMLSTR